MPPLRARARRLALWLLVALVLPAVPAPAQDSLPSAPLLVLDQERLFQGSRAASRISDEFEQATIDLAAENRRIEAELSAEELELTEARPGMDPATFRDLADAFDAKVQRLRAEQDAKERALAQRREDERQDFLRRITPVLAEIAREYEALAIIDQRAVILSADAIDITETAIARIDARFAADPDPEAELEPDPAPQPEPAPAPAPESAD